MNDQIYDTDTAQIWCNTNNIIEQNEKKEVIATYDLLGKSAQKTLKNNALFYMYKNGTVQRKIIVE